MKVYRVATGAKIELLNDPVKEALLWNTPLGEHQEIAVKEAGCELVDVAAESEIDSTEPHVIFPDDIFFHCCFKKFTICTTTDQSITIRKTLTTRDMTRIKIRRIICFKHPLLLQWFIWQSRL